MLGSAGGKLHRSQNVGQSRCSGKEESMYFVQFLGKIGLPPVYTETYPTGQEEIYLA